MRFELSAFPGKEKNQMATVSLLVGAVRRFIDVVARLFRNRKRQVPKIVVATADVDEPSEAVKSRLDEHWTEALLNLPIDVGDCRPEPEKVPTNSSGN